MTVGKINITDALKNVETLLQQDKSASPQLRAMMEMLVIIINLLLGKLGLNSKNSSTPPSKDPKRQRGSKRKAKGEKRKPGGQNGHEGTTLEKVAEPDNVETIQIDRRTIPVGTYTQWCRDNRHRPMKEQFDALKRKMQGHYGYYGITGNYSALVQYKTAVERAWRKWLDRRSQKRWFTWERFKVLKKRFPLPKPRIVHSALAT